MKTIKIISILFAVAALLGGCKKDRIDYYDAEYNGVRFPGNFEGENVRFGGTYDMETAKYRYTFTFRELEDPSVEHTDLDIGLVWMGIPPVVVTDINIEVVDDENNALPEHYEIVSADIPAGGNFGTLKLRVFNSPELLTTTRQLNVALTAGNDYMLGPKHYLRAEVIWNANVALPEGNTRRTYNMLIKSPVAWSSTSTANVSPKAVEVILNATGWDELIHYAYIYTGNLYQSWARKVGDYIATYNAEHPDDILTHDGGSLRGEPIEARTY